ncbi:hypothetical protein RJ641_005658 [Dillenia turbinata]|uniref:Uncharacterized protein n=1 Tax=Dillenia turbinata TaxID=194707 RepID=A0AAN8V6S5_9MAGN
MPSSCVTIISKCSIVPAHKSLMEDLKLSVSDLPMLSCHYIQKGNLFTRPTHHSSLHALLAQLKLALSVTLTHFPPLAGRLTTDKNGHVYISCNDLGVEFIHANAPGVHVNDVVSSSSDVHECFKEFFTLDRTVSYNGHFKPILAVQVTELADGVFIGCSVNHAVSDGTSFWHFFNSFAEICRGEREISKSPDFSRNSVLISPAVLKLPADGPTVTFSDAPVRERIFSFSSESILKLKSISNNQNAKKLNRIEEIEIFGKQNKGTWLKQNDVVRREISSFQSLCALLWRAVTRARHLPSYKTTTFRMAVNSRHRLNPKLDPNYFGNAIQSIPTYASSDDVLNNGLQWCAEQLNKNVQAHDNGMVRKFVADWERDPKCFPLGNFDGAMITMGSSPRFPMYDNDFGWGKPVAVRSGKANKFDGKISAFPGRVGSGSVDLEVCLAPETMAGVESDPEFMNYVTIY